MAENQCAETILSYSGGIWTANSPQCSRRGILQHEGKFYCKQHYPPAVKERRDKSDQKYSEEFDRKWEKRRYESACANAVDEAGITRPEGLKVAVELLQDARQGQARVLVELILRELGVPLRDG